MWKSAENAYQAAKCEDKLDKYQFIYITPGQAKRLGKQVSIRKDWEHVKISIMHQIVLAKFEQNKDLQDKLLNTGDEELVEGNPWNDTFWGVCRGKGENNLGKILMTVRAYLRSK